MFTKKIITFGWYRKNSRKTIHPVGIKKPNELGLFDMFGNDTELCQDRWHKGYLEAPTNGSAWESGSNPHRVLRGIHINSIVVLPEATRFAVLPEHRDPFVGFRLARSL